MYKRYFFLAVVCCLAWTPAPYKTIPTPDKIYGQLFKDIQLARIFPDGKTFVDCVPRRDPKKIVADYLRIKNNPAIRFSLQKFVEENFEVPKSPQHNNQEQEKEVTVHIKNLWAGLKREKDKKIAGSSLLPLPYSYIVPGGRFREVYYWDSYFTMLGLKVSGENVIIENMVKNFDYLINTYGHIPNGNRSYYVSRSQPPYFSMMVQLLASIKGKEVYKTYLPALEKEYAFWMTGATSLKNGQANKRVVRMSDGSLLNRYWDDNPAPRQESYREDIETAEAAVSNMLSRSTFSNAQAAEDYANKYRKWVYRCLRAGAESGWDFSTRWFSDKAHIETIETTDVLPVDLNCLLWNLEKTISLAKGLRSSPEADKRLKAIQKYFWNPTVHFYTDFHVVQKQPINSVTAAGMMPFFVLPINMTDQQHLKEALPVLNSQLVAPGGVVTTTVASGQQWDAPNGWAPLQWITIQGLQQYGEQVLAENLANRWVLLNKKVYSKTGKLLEKYNVIDLTKESGGGEYPTQDGFGWTNGVLLALIDQFKIAD